MIRNRWVNGLWLALFAAPGGLGCDDDNERPGSTAVGGGGGAGGGSGLSGGSGGGPPVHPPYPGWPIGIPQPPFGLDETVESVYGAADYCTRVVDNTVPCADDGPGTTDDPRCTIPFDLVAGDVVCIRAGTYEHGDIWMDVAGTVAQPIFIRGPDDGPRPVIGPDGAGAVRFDMHAEYLILENLELAQARLMTEDSHHVAIRHNEIHSHPDRSGVSLSGSDQLVYENEIHHFQGDPRVGLGGGCGATGMWIIGNHIHHNAEDSIQFGHGCDADRPTELYIGHNIMHSDRENAVDLKWVRDVVVSQNAMYGYRPAPTDQEFCYDDGSGCYPAGYYSSGSDGAAMVIGSDGTSENVWVLFNEIYDSVRGVRNEESTTTWIIGNVIYDMQEAGIFCEKRADDLYVLANALFEVDTGVEQSVQTNFRLHVVNNIIANPHTAGLTIEDLQVASVSTLQSNLFFSGGNAVDIRWGDTISATSSDDFAALTAGTVLDNLVGDPLFTDAAAHDFRPLTGSPAIDAGTDAIIDQACTDYETRYGMTIRVDLEGTSRPHGGGWDIGPYEQ